MANETITLEFKLGELDTLVNALAQAYLRTDNAKLRAKSEDKREFLSTMQNEMLAVQMRLIAASKEVIAKKQSA